MLEGGLGVLGSELTQLSLTQRPTYLRTRAENHLYVCGRSERY